MKPKFYLTTAITYASGKPHIGNIYEIILADSIARFKREQGYDVFFQTGTDEHGQKIEGKAQAQNLNPRDFVNSVAALVQNMWDKMNISYDRFIRTTEAYHEQQVQKIFKKLYEQGDIYKGEYQGWYCTPCESFWTESQLIDGKCPDCGREVKKAKEEAYFFKMSKYADFLLNYFETHPDFIIPTSRKNEMVNNFLKPGLQDLCVSRTSFKWGIPVDFDSKHVVYVWLDALTNYITGIGYDVDGNNADEFKYWPADVHIIGKDIMRFHSIYWPIFLKALDLPLPKKIFGHGWILQGNGKMGKSYGNVMYPDELADRFGVDAVRYYVLSQMQQDSDSVASYEGLIDTINSDLANVFGNLVSRTVAMVNKYFDGTTTNKNVNQDVDIELKKMADDLINKVAKCIDDYRIADAINEIMTLLRRANKYIDETQPWILAKDASQTDRLNTVLFNLCYAITKALYAMYCFMPSTSVKALGYFGQTLSSAKDATKATSFTVTKTPEILFGRLDKTKVLAEIDLQSK